MKKVGIIGCGGIAQVHAWVLDAMQNVRLTAFCDLSLDRAQALAEKYAKDQQVMITDDWRTLLDGDLDAVHICTPHDLHAPMAEAFLKADKAVFCEKPCAISLEQFETLKRTDEDHPGKLGFCFQNRYNETTQLLDKLLSEGRIGKLLGARAFVTWRRDEGYYAGSDWKGKRSREGGGALINQSIHTLDLLLRYLGTPKVVKGSTANHHLEDMIDVEDTVEAWMEFEGGRRGCFYASNGYAGDAPVLLELQGEKGRMMMNGQEVTLYVEDKAPEHFLCEQTQGIGKGYWGCGHKDCIRDFYECLENGKPFQNSLNGVENTFYVMMKIYNKGEGSWKK